MNIQNASLLPQVRHIRRNCATIAAEGLKISLIYLEAASHSIPTINRVTRSFNFIKRSKYTEQMILRFCDVFVTNGDRCVFAGPV